MNKIKIVYLVTFVKNVGVYNIVSNILNTINKEKYDVTLISCLNDNDKNEIERIKEIGINYICLNCKNKIEAILKGKRKFEIILKEINPKIVHSHAIISDYLLSKVNKKYKKITTIHCNIYEDYKYHYGIIKSKPFIQMHMKALKKFNKVVGCSKSVFTSLKGKCDNLTYVLNGIDSKKSINQIDIRKKYNFDKKDYIYIYIGSLSARKNVLFLIDNFKKYHHNNEKLLILGNGELLEECSKSNCKDIMCLGYIDNPIDYIKQSNVYISASQSEGMSVSVLEAMENGLYLFLSDIPSHKEIFELSNKIDCYVGENFTDATFENKMNELRKKINDTEIDKIKKFKNETFSAISMMDGYYKIYEEV